MSKIFYLFDAADSSSRIPVAQEAQSKGHDVVLGLIGTKIHSDEKFKSYAIEKKHHRFGILTLLNFAAQIHKIIGAEKPDILHAVTLKYGFISAVATLPNPKMRKVLTLAGLGYMFHGHDTKSNILRVVMKPLLSFLFKRPNTKLIFQNSDDMKMLIDRGYVDSQQCSLILGSGVDLSRFVHEYTPIDPPLVLMPTRLVHEKGISVFIEAARILKKRGVNAQFQIAGGETSHNPRAISKAEMLDMLRDGSVEWLGRVDNLPQLLSQTSLVVYPSYYGEGIPRVLLEACAAGCPIVTTDHTGCREAVTHGINGLLVPIKNAHATADAIETLLNDKDRRKAMSVNSRKRAEEDFDIRKIAKFTVEIYESDKFA